MTKSEFEKKWGTSGTFPKSGGWHIRSSDGKVIVDGPLDGEYGPVDAYLRESGCTPPDPVAEACKKYGFELDGDKWRRMHNGKKYHIVKDDRTELNPKIDTPEKVAAFCVLFGIPEQRS